MLRNLANFYNSAIPSICYLAASSDLQLCIAALTCVLATVQRLRLKMLSCLRICSYPQRVQAGQ